MPHALTFNNARGSPLPRARFPARISRYYVARLRASAPRLARFARRARRLGGGGHFVHRAPAPGARGCGRRAPPPRLRFRAPRRDAPPSTPLVRGRARGRVARPGGGDDDGLPEPRPRPRPPRSARSRRGRAPAPRGGIEIDTPADDPLALFDARRRRPPPAREGGEDARRDRGVPPRPRAPPASDPREQHANARLEREPPKGVSTRVARRPRPRPPPPPPPRRRERSTDGNAGGNADARPTGRPRRVFGSGATAKTSHGVRARVRERSPSRLARRRAPRDVERGGGGGGAARVGGAVVRRVRRRRGGGEAVRPEEDGGGGLGGFGLGRGGAGRPRGVGARVDGRRGVFEGVVKEGAFLRGEGEEEEHAYESNERETKRWCGTNQRPRFPRSGGRYIRQRGKTVEIARYVINRRLDALLFFSRFLGSSKMARQARK